MLRDCVIIGYPSTFIMRARHTERQAIPPKVSVDMFGWDRATVSFPLISLILPGSRLKSKTNIDIVIFEHFVRLRTIISPERPSRLVRGRTIGERSVNQRHETIRNLLAERGRLAVDDLAVELGVTPMTIRRDFTALEKAGVLTRTHGGCVSRSAFVQEVPFSSKERKQQRQKVAIARAVIPLIQPGATIYLDTGTTAVRVAGLLPDSLQPRVFTNNLRVAMELFGRAEIEVVVYGGDAGAEEPRPGRRGGNHANSRFPNRPGDHGGRDALDAEHGEFYSADLATAMLSRAAQERAAETLVVLDGSKFGKRSLAVVGRLDEQVTVVTDASAPAADRDRLLEFGTRVIVAGE